MLSDDDKTNLLALLDGLRASVEADRIESFAYASTSGEIFSRGWINRNLSLIGAVTVLSREISRPDHIEVAGEPVLHGDEGLLWGESE